MFCYTYMTLDLCPVAEWPYSFNNEILTKYCDSTNRPGVCVCV